MFSVFFLHSLFDRIKRFAGENGYQETYSTNSLFWGFLIFSLLSLLPDFLWLISVFSFVFLIPPFEALNYALRNSPDYTVVEQESMSSRQIGLIVVGILFWILMLSGNLGSK